MAVSSGADLVVVWGGDGTVNEVGSALVGSTTALGLVPAGSGNGLAASLCVPREPVAALGPSPGFRELKWLKPVYAGDTVSYATEIIDKRTSSSRPEWGLMSIRNTGVNQNGELVISFISVAFVQRRVDAKANT